MPIITSEFFLARARKLKEEYRALEATLTPANQKEVGMMLLFVQGIIELNEHLSRIFA